MNKCHNARLTHNAQALRRNMTKEERHLWYDFLKQLPISIKRQKIFDHYIVDFYIPAYKIIIELDGSQHFEESGLNADSKRDSFFHGIGFRVLRYANSDVNRNFDNVCQDILNHITEIDPHFYELLQK